jgi:hypothetical protein
MQSLIDSYERLKSKFSQFQTRCLSEKQKRECGLSLVAPALLMPQEKDRLDEEIDMLSNPNDAHNSAAQSSQSRMGGRIGARLESLPRREDDEVFIGGDTLRQPLSQNQQMQEDGNPPADEDQQIEENANKVSREPEKEPHLEEQKASASQFNVEDSLDGQDGRINKVMSAQNNAQRGNPAYKTKNEKDFQAR